MHVLQELQEFEGVVFGCLSPGEMVVNARLGGMLSVSLDLVDADARLPNTPVWIVWEVAPDTRHPLRIVRVKKRKPTES